MKLHKSKKIFWIKLGILLFILILLLGNTITYATVDQAGVFATADFSSSTTTTVCNYANNGLKKLGYNVTHYNSQANDREDILSYIRLTGKNYAFFFFGHSNSSNITAKNGYASGTINANDISGYWHFVVLAGCNTAENTTFADAFNVSSGSNKAFLGFYQSITAGNSLEWNRLFWNYVGTMNLRQCALEATEFTDIAGSVPIRMYGDKTWWGNAWNT